MGFDWVHEVELYRDLIKKLNRLGFQFEDTSKERGHSDLIDAINRVIVEVKLGIDAAEDGTSQVLYEMGREELRNFLYVGLADSEWFHMFESPEYGKILTFAKELDPELKAPPSSFSGKHIGEAMVLLGKPIWQGMWNNTKDDISKILKEDSTIPFISENLFGLQRILVLYKIHTPDLIAAFTGINVINVKVTSNRVIVTRDRGDPVVIKYSGEMKHTHKWIIERLRIPDVRALDSLRHVTDRLQSVAKRQRRGAYYTEPFLSMKMAGRVLQHVTPDFIVEPYAGAGSLLVPFVERGITYGWINDFDPDAISMLSEYREYGFTMTCKDMIDFPIREALKMIGDAKEPLFITNPPFSSTSGKLKKIEYGGLGDKYGRGNQIYPTVGKLIEIMKQLKRGYLAFFSPMALFSERQQYKKLLNSLLCNFEFIDGYIWSGKHFNDVNPEVSVAFTIWKLGGKTDLEDIQFDCENYGLVGFKRQPLLKSGWKYDTRKHINGEIGVTYNFSFNCSFPKIFHNKIEKGGSEVVSENVKKTLNIDGLPDELIYALWTTVVGSKSIIRGEYDGCGKPLHVAYAYVHLPDFDKVKSIEILAYALLDAFIAPDYTDGKIGFIGLRKIMKFGDSQRLNDGARYLFRTYGDLPVGEQTISEVLEELKRGRKQDNWKSDARKEISDRLNAIGYWDYIPLPLRKESKQKTLDLQESD